jgi:sulfatase maturation enzyme AslB (radical SAM superfamily)
MTCYTPNGEKFPCERYASNNVSSLGGITFEECSVCDYSKVCERGCLYQNNSIGINLNLCEIYKCIFDEVIRLNNRLKNNLLWKQIVRNLDRG